jgi:lipopolysaccharide biosynthesis regulator YciM
MTNTVFAVLTSIFFCLFILAFCIGWIAGHTDERRYQRRQVKRRR